MYEAQIIDTVFKDNLLRKRSTIIMYLSLVPYIQTFNVLISSQKNYPFQILLLNCAVTPLQSNFVYIFDL